jgi:hypothetical protein
MRIDQINMTYDAREDRIVLRVRTQDAALAALMFTRRLTRGLLGALLKLADQGAASVPAAADPVVRREVLAFQHQAQVQASDFQKPFNPQGKPLFGEQPLLVTDVKLGGDAAQGRWKLEFVGRDGHSLNMGLDNQGLHALIKLFNDLLPQTAWDLTLVGLQGADVAGQTAH